ncbi:hypothetical protein WA158_001202 [Blastocystis sp. Blastoise]
MSQEDSRTIRTVVLSELDGIKRSLYMSTNNLYNNLVSIATAVDYITNYMRDLFDYADSAGRDLPEFRPRSSISYFDFDKPINIAPGLATYFGKEHNSKFSIPIGYLNCFPESTLSKLYYDAGCRDNDGCIILNRSEKNIPYALSIIKGENINISSLTEDELINLRSDLESYCLPIPYNLSKVCCVIDEKRLIEKHRILWYSTNIPLLVNGVLYTINRSDLTSRNLHCSFFEKHSQEVDYDETKRAFIMHDNFIYFKYIADFIHTGELHINEEDIYKYEDIKREFEKMDIYNEFIWKPISEIPIRKQMNELWHKNSIKLCVNNMIYTYFRKDLDKLHLPFFENDFENISLFNQKSGHFKLLGTFNYFGYINDYLKTGQFVIKENDKIPERIKYIKTEFERLSINNLTLWSNYLHYNNHIFPDSYILTDEYADVLSKWVGKEKKWSLLYRGIKDGYRAVNFHEHCDNKGETVVLITCRNKDNSINIFGGYTSISWKSLYAGGYFRDEKAFLFSLQNIFNQPCQKFDCNNANQAIYCHTNYGPIFGCANGIYINDYCNEVEDNFAHNDGSVYSTDINYECSLFTNTAGKESPNPFIVEDIEVYGLK